MAVVTRVTRLFAVSTRWSVGFYLSGNALENPIRDFATPTAVPGRPDERPEGIRSLKINKV